MNVSVAGLNVGRINSEFTFEKGSAILVKYYKPTLKYIAAGDIYECK